MQRIQTILTSVCVLLAFAVQQSRAQPDYKRTVIVDPQASTTYRHAATIQGGIDAIPANQTQRWTVLIYAGEYAEEVTLGDTKENVDIVGVDRDAVVIKPPSGENGVIIDGVGARNNTIRNLTIHIEDDTGTGDDLDGVLIKKSVSGDDPSGITIDNVSMLIDADDSRAIHANLPVSNVSISGVTIECTADSGSGIVFDDTVTQLSIKDSLIQTAGDDGVAVHLAGPLGGGVVLPNKDVRTTGSVLRTEGENAHAFRIDGLSNDLLLQNTLLTLEGKNAESVGLSSSLAADTVVDFDLLDVDIRHLGDKG